jgi:hypothetical protein
MTCIAVGLYQHLEKLHSQSTHLDEDAAREFDRRSEAAEEEQAAVHTGDEKTYGSAGRGELMTLPANLAIATPFASNVELRPFYSHFTTRKRTINMKSCWNYANDGE